MADSLTLRLLHACRAFQARIADGLALELGARGWNGIGPSQLAFLAELDCPSGTHASEAARRLGISRQAVHKLLRELAGMGILSVSDDPARGNRNTIAFTPHGMALMAECRTILAEMDAGLLRRLPEAESVIASLTGQDGES